ncbi:MAG: hypothetical protein U5R06_15690 [candidate division KSB1 bacterium]|nr:hypothetical protein [candidate division KSB1 bacterium]
MKAIFLICMLLTFSQLYAQNKQDCYISVKQDTVYFFLKENPKIGQGFTIERKSSRDDSYTNIFDTPIEPVLNPVVFADMLGDDYHMIRSSLGLNSPQEMLLRFRTDRFASMVYTMLYHQVGTALGRFYKAGGYESGETFNFRIHIKQDKETVQTIEKKVTISDRQPRPPQTVHIQQKRRSVIIEWDYPRWQPGDKDMAVQFYLYRQTGDMPYQRLDDKILLRLDNNIYHYTDSGVEAGVYYTYKMTAVDASGLESKPSKPTTILIKDLIAPAPPRGLTTLIFENSVELVWNMSPELDTRAYHIYRWRNVEKDSIRLNTSGISYDQPHYIDSTCIIGQQYYYAVTAVDTAGNESQHSNRISAFPTDRTPPGPPLELQAKLENSAVTLTWRAPADADVHGYQVARGRQQNRHFQVFLTPDPIQDNFFVDKGDGQHRFVPGQRYCYSVIALDTLWHPGEPAWVWISIPDHEAPARPGSMLLKNDAGTALTLQWNSSPSLDVKGYIAYRGTDAQLDSIGFYPASKRALRDDQLSKGKTYFYQIVAVDTAGNRSQPAVSETVTFRDYSPPPPVQYVNAQKTETGIQLSWERVVDFDLKAYKIYRSTLPTGRFTEIATLSPETLRYTDQQGTNESWYCVKAADTSGNESKVSRPTRAQE